MEQIICILLSLLPVWNIQSFQPKNTSAEIVVPSLYPDWQKHTVDADFFCMKKIIINSPKYGRHTILYDDNDYELISKYSWHLGKIANSNLLYAAANIYNPLTQKCRRIVMHRLIMGFPEKGIDHKNNNGLDNRRENLRICTQQQNCANRTKPKNNTSGFKGVWFEPKKKLYRAMVQCKGKKYGKRFKSKIAAAKHYNKLAVEVFGEFAKLNIIPNG